VVLPLLLLLLLGCHTANDGAQLPPSLGGAPDHGWFAQLPPSLGGAPDHGWFAKTTTTFSPPDEVTRV